MDLPKYAELLHKFNQLTGKYISDEPSSIHSSESIKKSVCISYNNLGIRHSLNKRTKKPTSRMGRNCRVYLSK